METVKLKTLSEGDKFKFRYQISASDVFQVQHKLISQTGGIGVIQGAPNDTNSGVYHPDTNVIPILNTPPPLPKTPENAG